MEEAECAATGVAVVDGRSKYSDGREPARMRPDLGSKMNPAARRSLTVLSINLAGAIAMHLKHLLSATAVALSVVVIGVVLAAPAANAETAKERDTITIAWLPNDSSDGLAGMRDEIASVIAKATGKKVENKLTTDYAIAIAALENGQAQIGWFGASEYLTSHARNPKVISLVVNTGPSGTLKDALYYSRLVVKKGDVGEGRRHGRRLRVCPHAVDHVRPYRRRPPFGRHHRPDQPLGSGFRSSSEAEVVADRVEGRLSRLPRGSVVPRPWRGWSTP